jgi:hypothetical protein
MEDFSAAAAASDAVAADVIAVASVVEETRAESTDENAVVAVSLRHVVPSTVLPPPRNRESVWRRSFAAKAWQRMLAPEVLRAQCAVSLFFRLMVAVVVVVVMMMHFLRSIWPKILLPCKSASFRA